MSAVSLVSSVRQNIKIKIKLSMWIAFSSIIGGAFGKLVFNYTVESIHNSELVTLLQASILAILMVVIFIFVKYKHRFKTYQLKSPLMIIGVGFILGMLAAFLGIGGGSLYVGIFMLFFFMIFKVD